MRPDPHDAYYGARQRRRAELFDLQRLAALLAEHRDAWPAMLAGAILLLLAA